MCALYIPSLWVELESKAGPLSGLELTSLRLVQMKSAAFTVADCWSICVPADIRNNTDIFLKADSQ